MKGEARYPEFYIVGAPRCGTTFMFDALGLHPRVFVPWRKEPNFFCRDLDSGSYLDSISFMRDPADYQALFANAGRDQLAGEASTWYLYSSVAADRIKAVRPDARIIAMLRDPVDMMYSLHGRRRFGGTEVLSFVDALAAEEDRRHGRQLPPRPRNVAGLLYREVARYAPQLERYLRCFDRSQVHVIIFEDFRADPAAAFAGVQRFLELDPIPLPATAPVNISTRRRSDRLERLALHPRVVRAGRVLLPHALRRRVGPILDRVNAVPDRREPLDPDLRGRLVEQLRPDVDRLSQLLGRDLEALWFDQVGGPPQDEPA